MFFIGGWYLSIEISHLGVFEYAALHTNDALMRGAAQKRTTFSAQIRIVNITKDDFEGEFGGRLPLSRDKVSRAVCALVNRSPKALIVDLDTSDKSFSGMALPENTSVPVIWARGADPSPSDPDVLAPQNVLGVSDLPTGQRAGLSVNFLGLDWSVRQYPRWIRTTVRERTPSLHWKAYCVVRLEDPRCHEDLPGVERELETPAFDRFIDFQRFPLGEFVARSPATAAEACASRTIEDARIAGQIVILGGSYSSCDLYKTAFGDRPGAEIVGAALEEELTGDRSGVMGKDKYLWKLSLALVIVALHTLLRPVPALLVTVGLLALLVWQGVWLAFHFVNYRASVVPFLIAIVVEQILSGAERAQHLVREVERLEEKLKAAARDFQTLEAGAAALGEQSGRLEVSMLAEDLAKSARTFAADVSKEKP